MKKKSLVSFFVAFVLPAHVMPAAHQLHDALRKKDYRATETLLRHSRENVNQRDSQGMPPLLVAACVGIEYVKLLLEAGADLSVTDKENWNALHYAALYNHADCIPYLISFKLNPNAVDKNNNTPLHAAAVRGNKDCIQTLLEGDVNIDTQNKHGYTALHLAAMNGHTESVALLIDQSADCSLTTGGYWHPRTAEHLAAEYGHPVTEALLKEAQRKTEKTWFNFCQE